jgi:hypothetical protein
MSNLIVRCAALPGVNEKAPRWSIDHASLLRIVTSRAPAFAA